MREIKFRSWDGKKMTNDIGLLFIRIPAMANDQIMQFTGLKDKNGKDIYEGDVLIEDIGDSRFYSSICFEKGSFCIESSSKYCVFCLNDYEGDEIDGDTIKLVEVVGNIFENRDLYEISLSKNSEIKELNK